MSIESEIIAVIESRNGRADRLAIMATLHSYTQGSIEVQLSRMVKLGAIVRVSKGVYRLPTQEEQVSQSPPIEVKVQPRWLANDLAPYQRVRLYIGAVGRPKKQAVLTMLAPFVDGAVRALGAMIVEGMVHQAEDGCMVLGRDPKYPVAPRHRDPARGPAPLPPAKIKIPDKPVEAKQEREASAEATSEVQETVATSTLAADEPDVSAVEKTPAPEIGPAPAEPLPLLELAREGMDDELYEHIERLRMERGKAPCEFEICVPGFRAVVSGEARAAFQAIKRIIAAAEGAA